MSTRLPTIRSASVSDMELLLQWARDEGWNPGLDDAELFRHVDPEGFFMAYENDRPVAGISVVKHGDHHGFLGLYICQPDFRGGGHGWAVWQAGMNYLSGRVIGLDGVLEQQENYRKSGFELAHRNIRYSGESRSLLESAMAVPESGKDSYCRAKTHSDWPELLEMDSRVHGYSREQMLRHWLADSPTRFTRVCTEDGRVVGFGSIRQCHEGFKVGPLIGSSPSVACALLKALVESAEASTIILDIPETNSAALDLASSIGLLPVFETARMYKGQGPEHELHSLFAVSSLELG